MTQNKKGKRQEAPLDGARLKKVYREALEVHNKSGVQYAVGAAFARYIYTSIWRQTLLPDRDISVPARPLLFNLQQRHLTLADLKSL